MVLFMNGTGLTQVSVVLALLYVSFKKLFNSSMLLERYFSLELVQRYLVLNFWGNFVCSCESRLIYITTSFSIAMDSHLDF